MSYFKFTYIITDLKSVIEILELYSNNLLFKVYCLLELSVMSDTFNLDFKGRMADFEKHQKELAKQKKISKANMAEQANKAIQRNTSYKTKDLQDYFPVPESNTVQKSNINAIDNNSMISSQGEVANGQSGKQQRGNSEFNNPDEARDGEESMDIEEYPSQGMGMDGKAIPSAGKKDGEDWADDSSEIDEDAALEEGSLEKQGQGEQMEQEEEDWVEHEDESEGENGAVASRSLGAVHHGQVQLETVRGNESEAGEAAELGKGDVIMGLGQISHGDMGQALPPAKAPHIAPNPMVKRATCDLEEAKIRVGKELTLKVAMGLDNLDTLRVN